MEYLIETKDLTKQYGKNVVVRNVNIHVPSGKIYALLGRNGAGKTTLMKMILKLIRSTKGEFYIFGTKDMKRDSQVYQKIGSIIETPGFYENLTAYENLDILMRLRNSNKEGAIIRALEMVGLQNESTKPFMDYSLGMKQRLGIAAALMHEPRLLILDEPTNGLDPVGIAELRTLLTSLCRDKGMTILISSHVLNEIEQIAEVIGVMHEGVLIEEIYLEDLRSQQREYVEYEISDVKAAEEMMHDIFGIHDCHVQGDILKVFDASRQIGIINTTFVEHGLTVTKISVIKESLEEYFLKRIGGVGIA